MSPTTPRPRNAAATRQAILDSAVTAFTRHGYDGVGVRDIAADAGVTAMLVNRYFGSKEGLFAEVVDVSFARPTLVPGGPAEPGGPGESAGPAESGGPAEPGGSPESGGPADRGGPDGLAGETARALVARTAAGAEHLGPFELMLRSAANPKAAEIMRAGIERHVGARFTAALRGPHPAERAELGLALLAGTWLMRRLIGTAALRDADSARLTDQVTRMLAVIVDPPRARDT